jgi:hypothetical protein
MRGHCHEVQCQSPGTAPVYQMTYLLTNVDVFFCLWMIHESMALARLSETLSRVKGYSLLFKYDFELKPCGATNSRGALSQCLTFKLGRRAQDLSGRIHDPMDSDETSSRVISQTDSNLGPHSRSAGILLRSFCWPCSPSL